jgi:hypothetical protein
MPDEIIERTGVPSPLVFEPLNTNRRDKLLFISDLFSFLFSSVEKNDKKTPVRFIWRQNFFLRRQRTE